MKFRSLVIALAAALAILGGSTQAPAASASALTASDILAKLAVSPEKGSEQYDRARFTHWIDADGNGCDTRREVLIAESTTTVSVGAGCALTGGSWTSPYDGATWTDPAMLEIDHLVPLQEAWTSGASGWNDQQRKDLANDLDFAGSLIAVTGSVNSSKGSRDPAEWLPPLEQARCAYATNWVLVKLRWGLSIDSREKAALSSVFQGACGSAPVEAPSVKVLAPTSFKPISGVQRLAGNDRFATALAISKQYASGVPVVYVTTGLSFPDALSAAPAAAAQGGPLLLVSPRSMPAVVKAEIKRLKPKRIVVVGGTAAVSSSVYSQLRSLAPSIRRDGGADRYATSRIVTERAFAKTKTAFIATGAAFPDALSASAAAGAQSAPVILVNGSSRSLDTATRSLMKKLNVSSATIAGGTGALSSALAASIGSYYSTTRLSGTDRYATSAAINGKKFSQAQRVFFAVGTNFADALAGAAFAGHVGSPLYVVPATCIPAAVSTQVKNWGTTGFTLLGGSAVLGSGVAKRTVCATSKPPAAKPKPPAPTPKPKPSPSKPGNPGDTKNCSDFKTQREAQKWFDTYYPHYGDIARLDRDNDRRVCETLP
ncbi:Excalibur calcium-binding domain-containing protein [Paramicrobacterium humi]|uniref:Excalibur calcium-binding domain-containing protein n=1 Tax=Paramicrobacterium humi TaxID=640635 RepID=A0A1H4IS13_9MICO|nr:cell wall-binding repeat-containing protein [Microbacterium humi]SEB36783.1 Excalibur calcium-binding domain-containing protein [Microbacterium humi]